MENLNKDPADVIRENAQHFIEGVGVLIPGADTKHSDDCPGCKIDAALEDMQQREADLGNALARECAKPGGSFDQWARLQAAEAALADANQRYDRLRGELADEMALTEELRAVLRPFVDFLNPGALMQGDVWPERFRGYQAAARAALDRHTTGTPRKQVKADPAVFGESNRLLGDTTPRPFHADLDEDDLAVMDEDTTPAPTPRALAGDPIQPLIDRGIISGAETERARLAAPEDTIRWTPEDLEAFEQGQRSARSTISELNKEKHE